MPIAERMNAAHIENMRRNSEDAFSQGQRLDLLERVDELHLRNRDNPDKPKLGWANYMFSGPKGKGKSNMMSMFGLQRWMAGYYVFHNAGLLFGYRIGMEDIYNLGTTLPEKSVLIIDEFHQLFASRQTQTIRQQTAMQALDGFRKKQIVVIAVTQQEAETPANFRGEVDYIYTTEDTRRKKAANGGYWPQWCCRDLVRVGPKPWRGRSVLENYGIDLHPRDCHRVNIGVNPALWWEAAMMQNSFEAVVPGRAFEIKAAKMNESRLASSQLILDDQVSESEFAELLGEAENPELTRAIQNKVLSCMAGLFKNRVFDPFSRSIGVAYIVENVQMMPDGADISEQHIRQTLQRRCETAGKQRMAVKDFAVINPTVWEQILE